MHRYVAGNVGCGRGLRMWSARVLGIEIWGTQLWGWRQGYRAGEVGYRSLGLGMWTVSVRSCRYKDTDLAVWTAGL